MEQNTNFDYILEKNIKYILDYNSFFIDKNNLEKVINTLNVDNFIIISWMIWISKTWIIKELLNYTNTKSKFFYFNKNLDTENSINKYEDFMSLFNIFLSKFWEPKFVILENINNVDWIKEFINYLNSKKIYKLMIIWNNIKISTIKEIEINTIKTKNIENTDLNNIIKYWKLEEVLSLDNIYFKERFLDLIKNEILIKDIFTDFWVKNLNLYNYVLSFIAKINISFSVRELHRLLNNNNINISLPTTIDYLNFSISAKIIKSCFTYDLKLNKEISSKSKYFFTDNWIRNSLFSYNLDNYTLTENLLFNELISKWYIVNIWKNWFFNFSFICFSEKIDLCINVTSQKDKKFILKEINKLLKINNIWNKEMKKYLIVDNISEIWIRKTIFDNLRIVELKQFLLEEI